MFSKGYKNRAFGDLRGTSPNREASRDYINATSAAQNRFNSFTHIENRTERLASSSSCYLRAGMAKRLV